MTRVRKTLVAFVGVGIALAAVYYLFCPDVYEARREFAYWSGEIKTNEQGKVVGMIGISGDSGEIERQILAPFRTDSFVKNAADEYSSDYPNVPRTTISDISRTVKFSVSPEEIPVFLVCAHAQDEELARTFIDHLMPLIVARAEFESEEWAKRLMAASQSRADAKRMEKIVRQEKMHVVPLRQTETRKVGKELFWFL